MAIGNRLQDNRKLFWRFSVMRVIAALLQEHAARRAQQQWRARAHPSWVAVLSRRAASLASGQCVLWLHHIKASTSWSKQTILADVCAIVW